VHCTHAVHTAQEGGVAVPLSIEFYDLWQGTICSMSFCIGDAVQTAACYLSIFSLKGVSGCQFNLTSATGVVEIARIWSYLYPSTEGSKK
jgi:hypothetical protein